MQSELDSLRTRRDDLSRKIAQLERMLAGNISFSTDLEADLPFVVDEGGTVHSWTGCSKIPKGDVLHWHDMRAYTRDLCNVCCKRDALRLSVITWCPHLKTVEFVGPDDGDAVLCLTAAATRLFSEDRFGSVLHPKPRGIQAANDGITVTLDSTVEKGGCEVTDRIKIVVGPFVQYAAAGVPVSTFLYDKMPRKAAAHFLGCFSDPDECSRTGKETAFAAAFMHSASVVADPWSSIGLLFAFSDSWDETFGNQLDDVLAQACNVDLTYICVVACGAAGSMSRWSWNMPPAGMRTQKLGMRIGFVASDTHEGAYCDIMTEMLRQNPERDIVMHAIIGE